MRFLTNCQSIGSCETSQSVFFLKVGGGGALARYSAMTLRTARDE
jgi:hypothetical protein